jgi:uncharacterized protein YbjQ (UPF0145 family)
MTESYKDVSIVNTETIVGEEIEETYGYVSSSAYSYFLFRKGLAIDKALESAMTKLQYQAFKDGADAVVNVRTTLSIASANLIFSQVDVFMEGTMVTLVSE